MVTSASNTILLVEDEPLVAMATQDALEGAGFQVIKAHNGAEAMALLDRQIADIQGLITDVRLGAGPSGWEVARHARQCDPELPIVYISGDSGADWPVEGVPCSAVVAKPYADAQVITAIATLLNTIG